MALYTIEYSTDNQKTWTELTSSYSGSVTTAVMNEYLYQSGSGATKAYFRTYIEGSDTGSALSDFNINLIGGMDLSFTSYYNVTEHKYMCVVNRGEYTNTSNPSLYQSGSGYIKSSITQIDTDGNPILTVRDENFHTFATGIGLYDDALELVAYAKFANPIKIEKNFDSVFIVKFDV